MKPRSQTCAPAGSSASPAPLPAAGPSAATLHAESAEALAARTSPGDEATVASADRTVSSLTQTIALRLELPRASSMMVRTRWLRILVVGAAAAEAHLRFSDSVVISVLYAELTRLHAFTSFDRLQLL